MTWPNDGMESNRTEYNGTETMKSKIQEEDDDDDEKRKKALEIYK